MSGSDIRTINCEKIIVSATTAFALEGLSGARVQNIADDCGLPKANVLYYFKSKQGLYEAVLKKIITSWNLFFEQASVEDDPAEILSDYIRQKMQLSQAHPEASRVFAQEIIGGAAILGDYLENDLSNWFNDTVRLLEGWMANGKMKTVSPQHLLFHIWASTQHYADFGSQITRLLGRPMSEQDFEEATDYLVCSILAGCGLTPPAQSEPATNRTDSQE